MSDDQTKKQFNIYLPAGLIRRLKYSALDEQLSLSDLVQRAMELYLDKGDSDDRRS